MKMTFFNNPLFVKSNQTLSKAFQQVEKISSFGFLCVRPGYQEKPNVRLRLFFFIFYTVVVIILILSFIINLSMESSIRGFFYSLALTFPALAPFFLP